MPPRRLTVLLLALAFPGCGDDDDDAPIFAEADIGAGGGSLTSGDGNATLRVAEGALAEEQGFFVDLSTDAAPASTLQQGYLFGPESTFLEPGHVSLTFNPGDVPPGGEHALRVLTSSSGGEDWICIAGMAASVGDGFANAVTTHLSNWAISLATCDDDTQCALPERCLDANGNGDRYCAIPCVDTSDCPLSMFCDVDDAHVCRMQPCSDGGGCTGESVCSADDGHGICDMGPTECGRNVEQFAFTEAGKCVLDQKCTVTRPDDTVTPCDDLGLPSKYCYHGWCVDQTVGCTCGDADCPCTP